jgi:hypothetical protein
MNETRLRSRFPDGAPARQLFVREMSRRTFLGRGAAGLGLVALNSLLGPRLYAAGAAAQAAAAQSSSHGVVNPLDFPPKAKRVIFLYQAGGPSHLETFDFKPKLAEMSGKPMPESFTKGQQIAQLQGQRLVCYGPTHGFKQFGQSGQQVCELFPHIGGIIDETCVIRSMWTEQINHDPAHTFMNSGSIITGRVLVSQGNGGQMQPIAARQWSAGILPSKFQGVRFNSVGDPVLYITNPRGVSADMQKDSIQTINALNAVADRTLRDPELQTRIAQYEMAFKMQTSVPGLMDMSSEPAHVLEMYGAKPGDGSFASNCLLARRLAERGVRFIQLYHRDWDHHADVRNNVVFKAQEVDRATAALITDLKQRGMLDETLVIWGGEFGRTPMSQGRGGRDHHIKGFSFMLAGGGVKKGLAYGATDELGYAAVEHPVSVHDFHATMLYLLGVDAAKLAVKYQGLDVRLTGPQGGAVVRDIIA